MKIGIDARFVGPSGTGLGKYTEKLIQNLQTLDKKNQYAIFLKKSNWHYLKLTNKNFSQVLADVSWYSLEEQLKMPKIYKKQNLDLLHVPHFNVPVLFTGDFVVTIHDLIHHRFQEQTATTKNPAVFRIKRFAYRKVIDHAIKKSKRILVPSNFVKVDITSVFKISPTKIVVTYEAAEEEYFNNKKQEARNKKLKLIYVGNAYPHKNLNRLLDAIKILDTKYLIQNTNLVLVCPRDVFRQRLQDEIKSRNLEKRVELKGYLKAQELKKLFQSAQAYVFPSLSEGFGIPGLDAMASSLPVVCSDIPTFREVYGQAALYFDPSDPEDIAQKIKEVLTSSPTRSDLVKMGEEQVKKYSWRQMAIQTLSVYQSVV